jgi:hypothetical protein
MIVTTNPAGTIAYNKVSLTRVKAITFEITLTLEPTDAGGNTYQLELAPDNVNYAPTLVGSGTATTSQNLTLAPGDSVTLEATLEFTASAIPGADNGNLEIRVLLGGAEVFAHFVALTAEAFTPSLVMVLDRSGSMGATVAGLTRAERLRLSAQHCLDLMLDHEQLGVVTFNHAAVDVLSLAALGAGTQRADAEALFAPGSAELDPDGTTSITAGLANAEAMLAAESDKNTLVVTDGYHNTPPGSTIPVSTNGDAYAIGIGSATDVSHTALEALTANSGGKYVVVTGDITGALQTTLDKYFVQILVDVKNNQIVVDPAGVLVDNAVQYVPFDITASDQGFDAILLAERADLVDFDLIAPNGLVHDNATATGLVDGNYSLRKGLAFFRFNRKVSQPGTWKARLRLKKTVARDPKKAFFVAQQRVSVPYSFIVAAPSDLEFQAHARASSLHVGAELLLTASVTEFGRPLTGATMDVAVRSPDGVAFTLDAKEVGPGRYAVSTKALVPGLYAFHFRAKGKAARGFAFAREALRTLHVWSAGQVPVDVGPVPRSEQGTTSTPPGQTGPAGGGGGPGGSVPPKGSLDDLFDRYPPLRRLLELCCGRRRRHHGCAPDCHQRCGHGHHHHHAGHHHHDHHHHGPECHHHDEPDFYQRR